MPTDQHHAAAVAALAAKFRAAGLHVTDGTPSLGKLLYLAGLVGDDELVPLALCSSRAAAELVASSHPDGTVITVELDVIDGDAVDWLAQ
jgi:hypothetical protein